MSHLFPRTHLNEQPGLAPRRRIRLHFRLLLFATLSLLGWLPLAGCSPILQTEQPQFDRFILLRSGTNAGQTFTARYRGLEGIAVYLRPVTGGEGSLHLILSDPNQAESELATATLPIQQISGPRYYRFNFEPRPESSRQDYFLTLEVEGEGAVEAGTAPGDSYLDGAMYLDGRPEDAQLSFRLAYRPSQILGGLLAEGSGWLWWIVAGAFLFVLPGWALLRLTWPGWKSLSWGDQLGLGAGLSLAIYPVLFLWTSLAGLQLGSLYAWLPGMLGLAAAGWGIIQLRPAEQRAGLISPRSPVESAETTSSKTGSRSQSSGFWPSLAFIAVIGLVLFTRLWAIRGLDVPMWGDSYQHTVIPQLLVENGGLFNRWEPYADLQTFTYHFGFHSLVSVFHWVTRLPMPQATLWTGQLVNALAVIGLYPLAVRIGKSPWAGVAAVLLAGLLSPMPMSYVNWGRYTQLAGQAILPAGVFLAWAILERSIIYGGPVSGLTFKVSRFTIHAPRFTFRELVPAWLLIGGLALTHYRVLIFMVGFFIAFTLLNIFYRGGLSLVSAILLLGIGGGIIFLPWFIHVFSGKILAILGLQLSTASGQVSDFTQQYNAVGEIGSYLPPAVWILFLAAAAWGILRREKGAALFSLWWLMLLVSANPGWLRLPGAGAISNFAVFIAAYIPVGLLIGAGLGWLLEGIQVWRSKRSQVQEGDKALPPAWLSPLLCLVLMGIAVWGARQRIEDVEPQSGVLAARPDLRAAAWIERNVSPEARFLVNSFFAYADSLTVGSDGGWWLPLLAHRRTTLPPINYGNEQGPEPGYLRWVNALQRQILEKGINDPTVLQTLAERGITHVYIGQRQGRVNWTGPVLEPAALLASSHFKPVYHEDRVWIFEIAGAAPENSK